MSFCVILFVAKTFVGKETPDNELPVNKGINFSRLFSSRILCVH